MDMSITAPPRAAAPAAGLVPLSVIILAKNEADMMERCLANVVGWADDVLVLDSGSTDGTREIAASLGARVVEQPWLGWSGQRNRGAALAKHDWVMCMEADEVMDAPLKRAIAAVLAANPDPRDGFSIVRRDEFFGRLFPNLRNRARQRAFIRFYNRTQSQWNPDHLIHEELMLPGRSIPLPGVLLHWRNFTLGEQLDRYLSNVKLEVAQLEAKGTRGAVWRMLLRPPARFLWCYVACGGWRMGSAGLVQAMMVAHSEWLRWATLWERRHAPRVPHPPAALIAGKES